jgi:hypothetical protein
MTNSNVIEITVDAAIFTPITQNGITIYNAVYDTVNNVVNLDFSWVGDPLSGLSVQLFDTPYGTTDSFYIPPGPPDRYQRTLAAPNGVYWIYFMSNATTLLILYPEQLVYD